MKRKFVFFALLAACVSATCSMCGNDSDTPEYEFPDGPEPEPEPEPDAYPHGLTVTEFADDLADGKCHRIRGDRRSESQPQTPFQRRASPRTEDPHTHPCSFDSENKGKPCVTTNAGYWWAGNSLSLLVSGGVVESIENRRSPGTARPSIPCAPRSGRWLPGSSKPIGSTAYPTTATGPTPSLRRWTTTSAPERTCPPRRLRKPREPRSGPRRKPSEAARCSSRKGATSPRSATGGRSSTAEGSPEHRASPARRSARRPTGNCCCWSATDAECAAARLHARGAGRQTHRAGRSRSDQPRRRRLFDDGGMRRHGAQPAERHGRCRDDRPARRLHGDRHLRNELIHPNKLQHHETTFPSLPRGGARRRRMRETATDAETALHVVRLRGQLRTAEPPRLDPPLRLPAPRHGFHRPGGGREVDHGRNALQERHSPLYGRMGGRDAPRGLRHAGPLHRGRPQTGHAGPRLAQRLRRRPQLLRPRHHLRRTRRLAVAGLHRGPHRADQPDQEQLTTACSSRRTPSCGKKYHPEGVRRKYGIQSAPADC